MRLSLIALSALMLGSAAAAQAPLNWLHVYNDRTSFTSRGFLGGNPGETLQGYPTANYRGIGDGGVFTGPKTCFVHGFGMLTQDQNASTVETYWVVFRSQSTTGEPDGSPAGLITELGPFDLPTTSSTSAAAWNVTVDFGGTAVQVPCKDENFYAGLRLMENQAWTGDGQSSWASAYTDPASGSGDPVRAGATSWAYQVDAAGAVRPTNPRSWNYRLRTERGAFQIGSVQGTDAMFGSSGNYPDITTHGLAFRVRDAAQPNRNFAILVADSLTGGPRLPVDGHLWINAGTMFTIATAVLDADGEAVVFPSGFGPGELSHLAGVGVLPFQAAILDFGTGRFPFRMTNAQGTDL